MTKAERKALRREMANGSAKVEQPADAQPVVVEPTPADVEGAPVGAELSEAQAKDVAQSIAQEQAGRAAADVNVAEWQRQQLELMREELRSNETVATRHHYRMGFLAHGFIDSHIRAGENAKKGRAKAVAQFRLMVQAETGEENADVARYIGIYWTCRLVLSDRQDVPISIVKALQCVVERKEGSDGQDVWTVVKARETFLADTIRDVLAGKLTGQQVRDRVADARAADFDTDRAKRLAEKREAQKTADKSPPVPLDTSKPTTPAAVKPDVKPGTTTTTIVETTEAPADVKPTSDKPGRNESPPINPVPVPEGAAAIGANDSEEVKARKDAIRDFADTVTPEEAPVMLYAMKPDTHRAMVMECAAALDSDDVDTFASRLSPVVARKLAESIIKALKAAYPKLPADVLPTVEVSAAA